VKGDFLFNCRLRLLLILATATGHAQWAPAAGPQGATVQSMTAIGESVFVGTFNGLLRSNDLGKTWSHIGKGMDGIGIKSIALVGSDYYVGTWLHGIWKRPAADGDFPWTQTGFATITIDQITGQGAYLFALTASGPYLVAGVERGAVWRLPMDQATTSIRGPVRARVRTRDRGKGPQYDARGREGAAPSRVWKPRKSWSRK
jgi:hypothetical protein